MIRELDSFVGLIGWKQGNLSIVLDAANLTSSTGRRYEDFSALITADDIYHSWPDWNSDDDTATLTTNFNAYLASKVNEAINQVFNSVFGQTNDLIENGFLFPFEFDFTHALENDTSFVGYEVLIGKDKGHTTIINNLKATFDADGTVKVLLFNSSLKNPVQSEEITVEEGNTVTVSVDWPLPFNESGGYYLGYLRDGLTPKAYNRHYEQANLKQSFTCAYFDEIKVDSHNTETMFDVNDITNVSETWGLNFDISTYKDWTEIAINNKGRFVDAIGIQVAVNVMDLFINSSRSNRKERMTKADAILALEGNNNPTLGLFTQGLRTRLQEEVKVLRELFVEQKIIEKGTLK